MEEMLEELLQQQLSPLERLLNEIIAFLPKLVVAIIIFLLTLYVAKLGYRYVKRALKKREIDPEVILLLSRVTQISIIVLGTIWALSTVDFNVTGFVAGLGIVGFTIGFALKDIAENFVAGVLLLLQQPFDIGDAVEAGGYSGTVTNIEIRSTTIRTSDGLMVIVPNADVYTNAITNYSKTEQRRISLDVGVGYETDLQQADDIMVEVAKGLSGVKDDPAPFVAFKEFADSSINATLYFWIDTSEAAYFDTVDAATKGVKAAFDREGINIPFPIRTVYMEQAG